MTDSRFSHKLQRVRRRRQRGVSLIEILIVLVILVVGILTIIRLYPSGFFSLESVGNSALADSIGSGAISAQAQNGASLAESIFPDTTLDMPGTLVAAQYSDADYDPDDPNTLNYARNISNETVTVPSPRANAGSAAQSVYVVSYGPIVLPVAADSIQLPNSLAITGPPWQAQAGDSTGSNRPQDDLYDDSRPYQSAFLVDLTHQRIAVPYAPYTSTGAATAASYAQKMVLMIVGSDGNVYTEYLNVPAATPRDSGNPNAPKDAQALNYIVDSSSNYQGGWFDPTQTYGDTSTLPPVAPTPPQKSLPSGVTWAKVMLYRPFQNIAMNAAFGADPYQFTLASANLTGTSANPGAILFNPLAAGGNGVLPLKAQISYQTYSWGILHEDRDIPALSNGDTSVSRLTLKNLLSAGAARQDNTIFTGLAGGSQDLVILDLDTGAPISGTLNNEDVNGPNTDATNKTLDVSYATGRITFSSDAFGDNPSPPGTTPKAHRVRIFYAGDADWTVAVQKAPAMYTREPDIAGGADPKLAPGQFAFDPSTKVAYFPRCDAGKTVEFDGISAQNSGGAQSYPPVTIAIDPAVYPLGSTNYVRVDLSATITGTLATGGASSPVTFTAVRGLSARAVVAWKERDQWKVHSVDTVLTRPQ